jgi:hypothetical protein
LPFLVEVQRLAAARPDLAVAAGAATQPPPSYVLMQEAGTGQIRPARYWLVRDICRQIVNCYIVREGQVGE